MTGTTSTELVVHNPATGEVIDLRSADTEQLASVLDGVADMTGRLRDFAAIIDAELLDRLDRGAKWTLRVGDPASGHQFEIKAPSPDAGTEAYDTEQLEAELSTLIADGVIAEPAAEGALERTVTLTVRVPFGHELAALVKALSGVDAIAGVPCEPTGVTSARKVALRGVHALRKVPGTGEALDRAKVDPPAPPRRVKVKRVTG